MGNFLSFIIGAIIVLLATAIVWIIAIALPIPDPIPLIVAIIVAIAGLLWLINGGAADLGTRWGPPR